MYRIGIFSDTYIPQINGVVTVIRLMEKELTRLGQKLYIFAPSHPQQNNHYSNLVKKAQIAQQVYRFPSFKFIFQKHYRVAIPFMRQASKILPTLDIVHSHTPFSMGLLASWTARKYDLPHIHTYHTFYAEYRHYIPQIIRPPRKMAETYSSYFCNKCHCVIAPSNRIKEELVGYGLEVPIISLPFGIDMERFNSPQKVNQDLSNRLDLDGGKDLLLYVGRLGEEKNIGFLLRAFGKLLSLKSDVRFIIVGDGPMRRELEEQAKRRLGHKVIFTGFIDENLLLDLYRKANIFVFASKTETQGIVILESFASGTPAVCLGEMGVLDLVEDGENGLLVSEDEDEFAKACYKLLVNRDKLKLMGEKAKEKAYSMSSLHSSEKLLQIYEHFV